MSGWIRQLGSGRQQACWRDDIGAQRSATFATRTLAKRYLRQVESDLHTGTYVDPAGPRTTFAQWVEQWLPTRSNRSASTVYKVQTQMRSRILPQWGATHLGDIRPMHVKAWVAGMSAELAPASVRGIYTTFQAVLAGAVQERLIPSSPCTLTGADLPRVARGLELYLTADEVARLVRVTPLHYQGLVHTAAWTGMRWGEVSALTWDKVDLTHGRIMVDSAAQRAGGTVTYGPPKTPGSFRSIVLDPETSKGLASRHYRYSASSNFVFTAVRGGPLRQSTFSDQVWNGPPGRGSLPELAGLPAGVTFHTLRHTHASLMIAAGMDVLTLARRLGHSKPSMTLDRYGHLMRNHDEITLDAIAKAMS